MRGELTINLKELQGNYKRLKKICGKTCETAAVVKADAYGLGVAEATPALYEAGARSFFVATLEEGIEIRRFLRACHIYILNGYWSKNPKAYTAYNLTPVLSSKEEIKALQAAGGGEAVLNFDTGMNRLGLRHDEMPDLKGINLHFIMSHLTSSEEPDNPCNAAQLNAFKGIMQNYPRTQASFANSWGIFLGMDYRFQISRPGIALYGSGKTSKAVVTLKLPILQIRAAEKGETAGYNKTYTFDKDTKLAVVSAGYADGLHRTLSNNSALYWGNYRLPIRGRISMDTIICDLSEVPENDLPKPHDMLELIGKHQTLDKIAKDARTIPYEILTSFGNRYKRSYV